MTALHETILRHRDSDAPAVDLGRAGSLSYRAFFERVDAVSARLSDMPEGASAGILSSRTWVAYATVIACFLSGRCFVPLNPDFPPERLAKIVRQGGVALIAHDPAHAEVARRLSEDTLDVADAGSAPAPAHAYTPPAPDAIAYQMFTSGSTGDPKGVPIRYSSLAHYVAEVRKTVGLTEPGRYSQVFDLSFDLAMHDIFVALANGGTLVPAGKMDLMMPHSYIQKKQIDHWFSVPMLGLSAARGIEGGTVSHRLRSALFCGEPLPYGYVRDFSAFVADGVRVWNLYGPTEATIAFTAKPVDTVGQDDTVVPLGTPFGQNRIAIEDETGVHTALSDGIKGELLLGGPQVFEGYNPPVNPDSFTPTDPVYYRSGDLVKYERGELHHLGRKDSQIKIRGYRVELGDIEVALRKTFNIRAIAVVLVGSGETSMIAAAYEADQDIDDTAPLNDHLPVYMIPQAWKRFDALPVNVNGKIDRRALREMDWRG